MLNDLKSNGEHAGGANNDFSKFAAGDNADRVLSASYQNKLIAGVERANRKTYGSGVIDFGPVSLQKGHRRAPESGNRIRVRLDYPYRAPMGAAVGIDFPVFDERIQTAQDVVNFLDDPSTVYSCTKNQYRHHNRWGILEQELLPGQEGWAAVSGVVKTFWHAQRPLYSGDTNWSYGSSTTTTNANGQVPGDTQLNLPLSTTNSHVDEYRQLGILSARYNASSFSISTGQDGSEHYYTEPGGNFNWNNRSRPWWPAPLPRVLQGDETEENEIDYPYSGDASNGINVIASSRGRAMGISGYVVPDPSCSGSTEFVCSGGQWRVNSSTCSNGCDSWWYVENWLAAYEHDLLLPCADGETKPDIPCSFTYPWKDYADDESGDPLESGKLAQAGSWNGENQESNGNVPNWIVGTAILGTPESPALIDSNEPDRDTRGTFWMPKDFPDPYSSISGEQWGSVLRACANLTCTYQCDGSQWLRVRGETPYNLNEHWRCKCPDDLILDLASNDLPCTASSQPREFTIGMIYGGVYTTTTTTTTTTTSTTSTTTTTTGPSGACCDEITHTCSETTQYLCELSGATWLGDGTSCSDPAVGITCHLGACCDAGGPGGCTDYLDFNACQAANGTLHLGQLCDDVCPETTTTSSTTTTTGTSSTTTSSTTTSTEGSSTTTSSTTTTTEGGSSTTTSSTTTTTEGSSSTTSSTTTTTEGSSSTTSSTTTTTESSTGACCYGLAGSRSCIITTQSDCEMTGGYLNPLYIGNGTECDPDPCD